MPVLRNYQCPDCEGVFEHLHMRGTDAPPAFCPLCGAPTGDVEAEVSAPHIRRAIGKSGDDVYRAMENSANQRAEAAAEHLGVDVSEMGAMKITDMKDNVSVGEISAVAAPNPVSTFMGNTGVGGLQSAEAAQGYAAAAQTGPFAGAGNAAREALVGGHAARAARMAAAGCSGKFVS